MKTKYFFFLFAIFFVLCVFIVIFKYINPHIAWLSFPFSLLALRLIDFYFFQAYLTVKFFPEERISINLIAAGLNNFNYKKKIIIKNILLIFFVFSTFIFVLKDDIYYTVNKLSDYFKVSYPELRVEYPSYANSSPKIYNLSTNNTNIEVDSSTYLEINIKNLKKEDQWQLLQIEKNKTYPEKNMSYQLQNGIWSSSVQTLYSSFVKESIQQNQSTQTEKKNIELVISNKEKKYIVNLNISPVLKPIVTFDPILNDSLNNSQLLGKLNFKINVESKVPLTNIELAVRTKSGYSFKKTLAEFANASEFKFDSENIELITMGIPFLSEDILYVKAQARTVISDLVGESIEYEFPIKTPLQVRTEIIKNLEEALKKLNTLKKADSIVKNAILPLLSKSAQLAMNLSQSGVVRRNIIESMNFVENMSLKNDAYHEGAKAKILSTLNILKRQQKMNEANNFIARLQNLKSNLFNTENAQKHLPEFVSESTELKEMSQGLNAQINKVISDEIYPLTDKEKSTILNLLQKDQSAQKLQEVEKKLAANNIFEAQQAVQKALDEANNHLGFSMQLLQQARLKAMHDAKIKLNRADMELENSKYFPRKKETLNALDNTKSYLEQTPRLGGEFNEFLQEAKKNTKKTIQYANNDSTFDKLISTQKAQEAVERAILSLQDEEESDKDMQKEQDAHSYRSTMDILAAQSVLDSTWRKKILDEISKLKSQGEASDSAMIRYLESRLR